MLMAGLMFVLLFAAILLGFPVVVALGGIGALWIVFSGNNHMAIVNSYYEGINNFVQMSVPFFILAGDLMCRAQITNRLIDFSKIIVGRVRSGLAYTTVLTSMFFAGLTGAGVSDVSALAPIFIPAMVKEGYKKEWASMLMASAAIIGPTIPPSIIVVIYGAVTNTSIGGMLLACTVPGVILGLTQMLTIKLMRKKWGLPDDCQTVSMKDVPKITKSAVFALLMPIIILGGILSGQFTPTEAAAVAAVYAFVVGKMIYRSLAWQDIWDSMKATVKTSAAMFLLMAAGAILTWMMARTAVPVALAHFLITISSNPMFIFTVSMLLAMFLGLFMDNGVALILIAPILAPIARQVGLPDLQFGASMIVALNIGLITPPFGMCLFAASTVSGAKFESVVKYVWPMLFCSIAVLIMMMLIPELSLCLPRLGGYLK
jgi:tripartite ATP-independent transporter DctM subunit